MEKGRVGPDHATKAASMQIFDAAQDSHDLSVRHVPGHRLFVAVPRGVPPDGGWPVLYMLDGNAAFDFLTPDALALAEGLVLVGIGYDTDRQFSRERRTFDFTPPDGPDGIRPDHVHEGRMAGGAGRFLDLLTGDLRKAAEAGLAVDPSRRALWGHSFGGLFTLFALMTRPQAFSRFAAISPSVWWDEGLMNRIAASAVASDVPFLMALSDAEKRSGADGPPPDGPAPATMALAAMLSCRPRILPGLRHIDTLAASFPLAFAFAKGQG